MPSPDLILFAISGALKLGAQVRAGYIDSTRGRELVLPLPDFKPDATPLAAAMFFDTRTVSGPPRLVELVRKSRDGSLSEDEQAELVPYHHEILLAELEMPRTPDGTVVDKRTIDALVTVRQWQRDPNPSFVQRLAGSLIEIGVDYFASGPGAAGLQGRHGGALKALLAGLDQIEVSRELQLGTLPLRLFTITMETVSAYPQAFSGDAKSQQIIAAVSKGLTTDVAKAIDQMRAATGSNDLKETSLRGWGEVVYRSVLSSAGSLLIAEPERFLGVTGEAQAALVASVGGAVLSLALKDPGSNVLEAFNGEGLELVAKSALRVLTKHPELVAGGDTRLQKLIAQIADDTHQIDFAGISIAPDIAHIVLEHTAENLPMLWPDSSDPRQHLALVAARTVLDIASRKPAADARWRLQFAKDDVLALLDDVLDGLVQNPGWLIGTNGQLSPELALGLEATLDVLRKRGDQRLSGELALKLVQSALAGAALRSEFLADVPGRGPLVAVVVDVVLAGALGSDVDRKVAWRLAQEQVLLEVVDTAIRKLADARLDISKIAVLETVFREDMARIRNGEPWSAADFGNALEGALKAA